MIAALHEYGVQCVVDLLNTVEINNSGGLASWVPKSITNTDKIVVLLTKEYIQVCRLIFRATFSATQSPFTISMHSFLPPR